MGVDVKKINGAINVLVGKVHQSIKPEDALRFTQAALNLAHLKNLTAAAKSEE